MLSKQVLSEGTTKYIFTDLYEIIITLALIVRDCAMSESISEQLPVTDHVYPAAKTCTNEFCLASSGDGHLLDRTSQQLDTTNGDNRDTKNQTGTASWDLFHVRTPMNSAQHNTGIESVQSSNSSERLPNRTATLTLVAY